MSMPYAATKQAITLHLPEILYRQAQRLAQTFRRPVEEILLDAVATALPPLTGLPQELADELADLAFLGDDELWQVARNALPVEHHQQVDDLLTRKGQGQLTDSEQQTLDRLLQEYQALVLRRGQAAVLLQRRGYEMSDLKVLHAPS